MQADGIFFSPQGWKYFVRRDDDGNLYDKQGKKVCEHGAHSLCSKCFPPLKCPHGKRKDRCIECGGTGLCEHKKQKGQCTQCRDLYGHGIGIYFCSVTRQAKRDCRHCREKKNVMEVVKTIKKDDYERRQQHVPHSVTLEDLDVIRPIYPDSAFSDERMGMGAQFVDDEFPFQEVSSDEELSAFVSAPGAAQGSASGAFFLDDVPDPTVFSSYDHHPENQGGRKRKKRFTRRLRRNHNTKKKSKMIKRKVTKRSRKNKHK